MPFYFHGAVPNQPTVQVTWSPYAWPLPSSPRPWRQSRLSVSVAGGPRKSLTGAGQRGSKTGSNKGQANNAPARLLFSNQPPIDDGDQFQEQLCNEVLLRYEPRLRITLTNGDAFWASLTVE